MMEISSTDGPRGSKAHDLGRFDDSVLICGGAYSNLEALTALFDQARKLDIPPERIIHTGDAVAYCADPAATVELLRKSGAYAIQGNVEESLFSAQPDCGCGFDEGSLCEKLSAEWFAYSDARIGNEARQWMGRLPLHLTFEIAGMQVRVVHGSNDAVNRFMFASQPDADFETQFKGTDASMIIAGHSGIPFTRRAEGRVWHNSGSLGLPANDGTPRVWFSVLTPQTSGVRIDTHALDYDHEAARKKMIEENVCREYAQALGTGLWPSLDVLPDIEQAATGIPLELNKPVFIECMAPASI